VEHLFTLSTSIRAGLEEVTVPGAIGVTVGLAGRVDVNLACNSLA
jgi:hypothetical protein